MKKLALIIILSGAAALMGCNKNTSDTKDQIKENNSAQISQAQMPEAASAEQTAPDFTLVDTQGKKVSLSQFKGKVVIIDFWATWCPPCRRGIPDLISIKKEFKNKIVVIGVSLDVETKKDVVPFIKNYGINYPVVYATNQIVQDYGNIEAIPTSFIIDKNGKIIKQHVGLTPKEVYINEINKLLKKS